jgi:hypothetical protein
MSKSYVESEDTQATAQIELDEPMQSNNNSIKLGPDLIRQYEESKNNDFKRKYQQMLTASAFKLLILAFSLMLLFYISDTILINLKFKSSTLLSQTFELLKYVTTTLIGYLFANNLSKNS